MLIFPEHPHENSVVAKGMKVTPHWPRFATGLVCLSVVAALTSCGDVRGQSATILHIPMRVIAVPPVSAWKPRCNDQGPCEVAYGLRVTNLSTTLASVVQCQLRAFDSSGTQVFSMSLVIGTNIGIYVPAGTTRLGNGLAPLKVKPSVLPRVARSTVTCQAWDWHGNPPP